MNPGKYHLKIRNLVLSILLVLFVCSPTWAVMPPKHYIKMAAESEIKALAEITKVRVTHETDHRITKEVRFRLIKNYGRLEPETTFTGWCFSAGKKPYAGGDRFYYPEKGEIVFVTATGPGKPAKGLGGMITSLRPMTRELEIELKKQKRERWFLFYINGKASGYLQGVSHQDPYNPMIRQFDHSFLVGKLDKGRTLYSIKTRSKNNVFFTPEKIHVQITRYLPGKTETHPGREIGFKLEDRADINGGILAKGDENVAGLSIPSETATDFILLEVIETFPYEKNFSLGINLLETLEIHLKKNILIRYMGKDPDNNNLHLFSQTGKATAAYWLNDQHELMELLWDNDKKFVRGTEDEAMTILQ